jgi:hypothetical protein
LKIHAIAAALAVIFLAGCSDMTGLLQGDWLNGPQADADMVDPAPVASAAIAPPLAEKEQSDFCQRVALQDAGANGFDRPTIQRVAVRNYQQCVALFGSPK